MSRLTSQYHKRSSQRFYLMVVVITILLILFLRAGLPSLINGAIYLQSLIGKSSETSTQHTNDFYGTLVVDDLPQATRESKLILSGQSEGYERITAFLNGEKLPSAPVEGQTFSFVAEGLVSGENKMYVLSTTKDGKFTKKSPVYTVVYLDKPPKLEISTPHDHDSVNKSEIKLEGKTDSGVTLKVNHTPVVVGWQGNFSATVRLKEGDNSIESIASDDAGNITTSTITVSYHRDE